MVRRLITACVALLLTVPGYAAAAPRADDYQLPTRPQDRLDLPQRRGDVVATATRTATYGLAFVAIPMRGYRLGFSERQIREMTNRVGDQMLAETDGKYSFTTVSYTRAPTTTNRRMSCNLDRIHQQYRPFARRMDPPPRGVRDTIAVYLTPLRFGCQYAGVALLGGRAVYLNGLDMRDPQRLQDWITAHELGHTLGLEHSAGFWPRRPGWQWNQVVPGSARQQDWYDYGDYLDLMGQPPKDGYGLTGAKFWLWSFNSLSLARLGVLQRANIPTITSSGTYTVPALQPDPAGGRMALSIPVVLDGRKTWWVLEYRPPEQNATTVNYPAPFSVRGYGVRVLLAPRGLTYPYYMNRVFRVAEADSAQSALPVGTPVFLAGGAKVTVVAASPVAATVTVTLPE